MKKFLLVLLAIFFAGSSHAKATLCGYRDYFHLEDKTHPDIFIVRSSSTHDIYLRLIGPTSFEIRDASECREGYGHITVTDYNDNYRWCRIDIKDGPYMMHPELTPTCNGMRYLGTTYDGFNSYSYTVRFD
jgi:hypothetical protein